MKRRVNLFLRHLLSLDLFPAGVAILMASLIISSLAACMEQRAQPSITPSPTQILQQAGPDSGLYIGSSIGTGANTDNAVYKIDYRSGKVLWKYQFKLGHSSSWGSYALPSVLIVQQGYVFFESQAGVVYALTAATGRLVWSYTVGSTIELVRGQQSMPVLEQGRLYIPGVDEGKRPAQGLLYELDASTEKLLQTYQSVRTFTILNSVLYASDLDDSTLRAINLRS